MNQESIENIVCRRLGVDPELIKQKTRVRESAFARQLCMTMYMEFLNYSTRAAGEVYGKDHATAVYSRKVIKALYEYDIKTREMIRDIKDEINSLKTIGSLIPESFDLVEIAKNNNKTFIKTIQ